MQSRKTILLSTTMVPLIVFAGVVAFVSHESFAGDDFDCAVSIEITEKKTMKLRDACVDGVAEPSTGSRVK